MRKIWALAVSTCFLWSLAHAVESPSDPSDLSLAAEARISTTVGQDAPAYQVQPVRGGFIGIVSSQHMSTQFMRDRIEIHNGRARWALAFRGIARGTVARAGSLVSPQAIKNRVEYARGILTEWYDQGPLGLEQGFTINRPPAPSSGQPFRIQFTVSGNLTAQLQSEGTSLQLRDSSGQTRWLYAGLSAQDASGKQLPAWIELRGKRLTLCVNDASAIYPIVVDPIIQLAELTAANGTASAFWGYSVAASGNTVVVGSPNATVGSNANQGAVYVFVKPSGGWANMTQTAVLTASDGAAGDALGSSVSIYGNSIVAGAPQAAIGKNLAQGAAYVFIQPSGGWVNGTQKAKLTASDGIEDSALGMAIAVAGNTVSVGAPYQAGTVYVYVKPTAGWSGTLTQTAELTGSGTNVAGLGNSLAMGVNTIAAGASRSTVNANFEQGAVYVFVEPTDGWVNGNQNAILTASDGQTFDQLGYSVSTRTNLIVAGVPNATIGTNPNQGAAYVFVEPGGGWTNMTQTAKLTASDGEVGDSFGSSVAVQGNAVVAGAPGATINSNFSQGAAYVFFQPASGWQTTSQFNSKLTATNGVSGAEFGTGVAVSNGIGVMAAPGSTVGSNTFQGAVFLFGK
jgi:trimeric autotransporter adhesin